MQPLGKNSRFLLCEKGNDLWIGWRRAECECFVVDVCGVNLRRGEDALDDPCSAMLLGVGEAVARTYDIHAH